MKKLTNVKILYIEDEDFIRKNAIEYLRFHCKNVYEAIDGTNGYEIYQKVKPDIIICDIMMPRLNGLELIEKIRREDNKIQIIVATARIDTDFLLKAVELRLVKYLTKPITENKLLPVLQKALELLNKEGSNILKLSENTRFDTLNKTLFTNGEFIKLTKKETAFVELCGKNKTRAVTYNELENYVWDGYMTQDAMRSIVKELRKKLPQKSLENVSGIGYKLNVL